jgi:hypothetical protein
VDVGVVAPVAVSVVVADVEVAASVVVVVFASVVEEAGGRVSVVVAIPRVGFDDDPAPEAGNKSMAIEPIAPVMVDSTPVGPLRSSFSHNRSTANPRRNSAPISNSVPRALSFAVPR